MTIFFNYLKDWNCEIYDSGSAVSHCKWSQANVSFLQYNRSRLIISLDVPLLIKKHVGGFYSLSDRLDPPYQTSCHLTAPNPIRHRVDSSACTFIVGRVKLIAIDVLISNILNGYTDHAREVHSPCQGIEGLGGWSVDTKDTFLVLVNGNMRDPRGHCHHQPRCLIETVSMAHISVILTSRICTTV